LTIPAFLSIEKSVNSSTSRSLRSTNPTFLIAVWVLSVVAAMQLLAVIWKVVPATIVRVATPVPAVEIDIAEAYRPASPGTATIDEQPVEPAMDPMRMQEAMTFVTQADKDARVGDWESVLNNVGKAVEIMGPNPRLLLQQAFALERMGREMESAELLNRILALPDLDPETRDETIRLRTYVAQTIGNLEASGIAPGGTPAASMETGAPFADTGRSPMAGPVIESIGLQPGAELGIVEVREIDAETTKTLRIAIKSRPGSTIDSSEVNIGVTFFEEGPEGDIFRSDSPVASEWISPPVDWADNEPEILDVVYPLPAEGPEANSFHGYTVAIYFRGELQDTRAVPGQLDQNFPAELFLENLMP
jgi:hypothetical protein